MSLFSYTRMMGVPRSLYNNLVPDLIQGNSPHYHLLSLNRDKIDIVSKWKSYMIRVTKGNWERLLRPRLGTNVKIPISCVNIHHHLVQTHGNDRVLELKFVDYGQFALGQTQLIFRVISPIPEQRYVGCRVHKLGEYSHDMYVRMPIEEIQRDQLRMKLVRWRECLLHTERRVLDEEIRKGNVTKDHASFLRMRVRKLIARTHEEHIEHKRALERICEMGRKYVQLVKERDEKHTSQ
jgi:hypothetical protein